MSKLLGLVDRAVSKVQKQVIFTPGTKVDSYFGASPISLPTTEPGTSQFITTITSGMLVTASISDWLFDQGANFCVAGTNTTASAITLSFRFLKNGSSQYTSGTSIGANYYWSISGVRITPVVVGDVVEVRMWANATGLDYRYSGLQLLNWNIRPYKAMWIDNLQVYSTGSNPWTSAPNPICMSTRGFGVYCTSAISSGMNFVNEAVWSPVGSMKCDPAAGFSICPSNTNFLSKTVQNGGYYTANNYMPAYYGYGSVDKIMWTPMQI